MVMDETKSYTVEITDDLTGEVVFTTEAPSVTEALVQFLQTTDETTIVTPEAVYGGVTYREYATNPVAVEIRGPIFHELEACYVAMVIA
jgi:hypothetical protein